MNYTYCNERAPRKFSDRVWRKVRGVQFENIAPLIYQGSFESWLTLYETTTMPTEPDPEDRIEQYTGPDRCPSCDGWGKIQSLHCTCPACSGHGRRDARMDAAARMERRG